jgi:hypothetical protein
MSVSVVTYRKGGTTEAVTAAAKKGKVLAEKHGATQFLLNQVIAGPDAGRWAIVITFPDFEVFGKAMKATVADPAFHEFLSSIDQVSEVVSRRVLVGMDV